MKNHMGQKKLQGTHTIFMVILLAITLVLGFFDVLLGSVKIPFSSIVDMVLGRYDGPEEWKTIVMEFRLPRTVTALLAGSALSVSGLQMQTIFRNPLAGPYVLGISSGASLGVALLVLGFSTFVISNKIFGNWAMVMAATFGSGLLLVLLLLVSVRIRNVMTILILGILFGSIATAIVAILQYFSSESLLKSFIMWTMGSLGNVTMTQLKVFALTVLVGLVMAFLSIKLLNGMLLGEDTVRTMGLNPLSIRIIVFSSTSLLAGGVTAFCGPIGFLGIVVPHLARMVFNTSDHRILLPGSFLIGSSFLLLSDLVSQLPGTDQILPINSVTALFGIPMIVWIIVRRKEITAFS